MEERVDIRIARFDQLKHPHLACAQSGRPRGKLVEQIAQRRLAVSALDRPPTSPARLQDRLCDSACKRTPLLKTVQMKLEHFAVNHAQSQSGKDFWSGPEVIEQPNQLELSAWPHIEPQFDGFVVQAELSQSQVPLSPVAASLPTICKVRPMHA